MTCTCAPCEDPAYGYPGIAHCAACCAGSGIAEYAHDCPIESHRLMAIQQFGPLPEVTPMNHADRERLSQLLTDIGQLVPDLSPIDASALAESLAEARAIVDQPAGIITINGSLSNTAEIHRALRKAFEETGTDGKYTILNEPLHEYRDHAPTRRRHRAIRPITLATALTLAAIGLIAATALTTTPSSTQGPRQHSVAPNTPPEAAQHARGGYTYPPRTP